MTTVADVHEHPMRLEMPVPAPVRAIFVGIGLFVIGISTWELWRGVLPLNIFSPFYFLILAGAWSIGVSASSPA